MDNLIGRKLDGRYLIEQPIGVGGMANVYRGTDIKTGNAIAVKVLKEEFLDNEELVRRFKNESKAISILNHPNIVKVYDVSVTDKLQYIVMEYVDGITLKEYLKQRGGALTWKETVHFATQVLSALQHAHAKGIIHRDVKPQNIMLLADGSIKMMDFGIARFSRAQSQTVSDKAIGSVHYISPEQAKGDRTDARTDLYSVGVMLYEMLSGRLPFDGDGAVSIAIMQISDKARPLAQVAPNVPEGLRQITEKAMEKDPAARYQSAQEMLDAIDEFKHNPSIRFEYEYRSAQNNPDKTISKVVNGSKMANGSKPAAIRTGEARRTGTSNPGRGKKRKKKKQPKPFSLLPIFAGMAVAFVIGAGILIYLIFANSSNLLFSNLPDVTLISYVGMTEEEFRASDYNSQLRMTPIYEYNSRYPEGTIFQQNPKPGRTVKEGQKLTLKISMGTEWVTVPETKNMASTDAEKTLKDLGLTVVKTPMQDETVAADAVIYSAPAAGEKVEGGTTITIYVSRAKIDIVKQVPSVTGIDVSKARMLLAQRNLVPKVIEQPSAEAAGTVLSQSPAAGSQAKINTPVTLIVSSGVPVVVAEPEPSGGGGTPGTEGKTWDEWVTDANGNSYWTTVVQHADGSVYRIDNGERLW